MPRKKTTTKKKSTVNKAGNYTKPTMRKRLFERIKAGSKGGKPGQWSARKGTGRRLYTDENPKDTISIKFKTPADARATVAKVKRIKKPFARKIQILTVLEQRAKVAGKTQQAKIAKQGKEAIRKKHGKTKKVAKKS
jgi:hypothetical protein